MTSITKFANNSRVGTRLGGAFGSVLLVMALLSLLALHELRTLQADFDQVVNDNNVRMEHTHAMLTALDQVRINLRNVVLIADEAGMNENQARLQQAESTYRQASEALRAMPADAQEQAVRERIEAAASSARPLNAQVLELGLSNRNLQALSMLLEQAAPATDAWTAALEQLLQLQRQRNALAHDASQRASQQALVWVVGGNLLGLALTLACGTLVARSITTQLGGEPAAASALARAIARGDLSVKVELRPGDDSSMMAHFQRMIDSLSRVVSQVRHNAESVADASAEIAGGNRDLSLRTEQQANSLEETAATMEQLGSAARQNAAHVGQASELALRAAAVATRGGQVVEQVVGTMRGIDAASKKISDIINVIDGIAFQTNILALNAAVEAARAGEQGRGFAVVASEVRSLAQRSAAAAKEVATLITTSVARVEQGSALVDQAGATMAEVVTAIQRMTNLVGDVKVASDEQSASVAQVGHAVGQMDRVTQQNAVLVEQSARTALHLQDQSRQMVDAVSIFKLS